MVHRGVARQRVLALLVCALLVGVVGVLTVDRATGTKPGRCAEFTLQSHERALAVTGSGADVLVIGDSWTAGLGLDDLSRSWPSRLPGRVHVAGFSGSGYADGASACGRQVSFASRAGAALRAVPPGTPVVVAGGLNDWDSSGADIRAGFEKLVVALEGHPVTVVGPAAAPARSTYMPRVESLLRTLCAEHGLRYVAVGDLRLDYLPDLLHLQPSAHAAFGDEVARRISSATVSQVVIPTIPG